jgi:hypothetical protein
MKDVTLVAIEFQWYELTEYAIKESLKNIDVKDVVIISDDASKINIPGARHIQRAAVSGMAEYNQVMLKEVVEHINTEQTLYAQWDGIAFNRDNWSDDFLNYDYIGAVWPWEPEGCNVGNGGFSLRSRRLLEACQDKEIELTAETNFIAEDALIGKTKRMYLESTHGIKFAPTNVAKSFSFELGEYVPSFGFHGLWNIFHFMDDDAMTYFASRIDYTGWNFYKWHHVLAAVIRRNRMDLYESMLAQMIEHSPELLDQVAGWLEYDSQNPVDSIIIR